MTIHKISICRFERKEIMPLNEKNSSNYWGNKNPMCPYYDMIIDIDYHELYHLYDNPDDSHYVDCPYCEKELRVQSNCKWTFSTDDQD